MSASQGDFPDLGFPGTERATIVLTDEDGREQRFSVHFEVGGEEVAPLTWFRPEEISLLVDKLGPGGLFSPASVMWKRLCDSLLPELPPLRPSSGQSR